MSVCVFVLKKNVFSYLLLRSILTNNAVLNAELNQIDVAVGFFLFRT